jgi:hypothetical protein
MKCEIKIKSNFGKLEKVLRDLTRSQCLIGIPEGKANRDDGSKINNATIGYINEFGSERMHIPARPHLVPGVKNAKKPMTTILEKTLKKSMQLKGGSNFKNALEACGLIASASVKNLLQSGLQPALAPATIKARARQTQGDHSGDIPLINTGNYMNHITYVVVKK